MKPVFKEDILTMGSRVYDEIARLEIDFQSILKTHGFEVTYA